MLKPIMLKNFIKTYALIKPIEFLALISCCLLLIVLIMEHIFNILPCKLCNYQRYPYYLIFFISFLYLALKTKISQEQKLKQSLLLICLFLSISNIFISLYHVSIEHNWLSKTINCATNASDFEDETSLLNHLTGKQAVSCDVAAFKIIFTLSEWNLIISLLLSVYILLLLTKYKDQIFDCTGKHEENA